MSTLHPGENIRHIRPSATLAVAARARELRAAGRRIVDLSAGQPDFPTPPFIAEAGMSAIREGRTRYAPAPGLPELRSAIAEDLSRRHDVNAAPEGVVVTSGAKQAIFNVLFTLFGPGDRVLVPAPYWTSYPYLAHLARAWPVVVPTTSERGFKVSVDDLEAHTDGSTRCLLLNSPSNPAGVVYSARELRDIAAWCVERGLWLISDEIYGRICFEGERAASVLDLPHELRERVVVVDGASKAFSMTGWRIGYSYSAPSLAARMAAVQSHITTSAATPCQVAAVAAYSRAAEQDAAVSAMRDAFHRRRDLVLELFAEHLPALGYVRPDGAFYLFFRLDDSTDAPADGERSVALCERILEETGVALVPGEAFGDDRYARLSFAASDDDLRDGIGRLATVLNDASFERAGVAEALRPAGDS